LAFQLPPFALERFFAKNEFATRHLLCSSDCEAIRLKELLSLADAEGLEWWENLTLGYSDYFGDKRLRTEIAKIYHHPEITAEQICCFAGAQEAVLLALPQLIQSDEHAIVVWPGYQSLVETVRLKTDQVSLLGLSAANGWSFPWEQLEAIWRPNTRLLVINYPHNPTGADLSAQELSRLAQFCQERGAWLFSDEVYRGPNWGSTGEDRPGNAASFSPKAISLGVLSKCYGLAGLRMGWLVVRDPEMLNKIAECKDYSSICNPTPSEALAFIAVRARQTLWDRYASLVADNANLFQRVVDSFPQLLNWTRPLGGTMAFPKYCQPGQTADDLSRNLKKQRDTLVLPGSVYHLDWTEQSGQWSDHFRIGLGRTSFPEALEQLVQFLEV
jgi:aspartate/methionine/tyrosine aminotransferase